MFSTCDETVEEMWYFGVVQTVTRYVCRIMQSAHSYLQLHSAATELAEKAESESHSADHAVNLTLCSGAN